MDLEQTQQQAHQVESLPTDLGSCVAGLVNTLAKGTEELMATHGLIPMEFALLRLFLAREEWTTTQLARELPVNTFRISRMVTKLVDINLMRRRRPRNDRRVVFLTLTDEGKTLTLDLQWRVHSYEAVISEGVSQEEMAVFASVTSRVMVNYAALLRSGPPSFDSREGGS